MKLHLPTRLRAAVLACITAVAALAGTVGTGTITTGVVAYTMSLQQAQAETAYNGVTYSGLIFDIATTESATFHNRQFTNFYDDGTGTWVESTAFAGNQNSYYDGTEQKSIGQNFWREKFGDGATRFQTLRLTGATSDVYLETQFSPFTLGGVIAEAGDHTYTIGRTGGDCAINIQAESGQQANLTIAADTRFSVGVNPSKNQVTVSSGGTWNIAAGKSLTMAHFTANGTETAAAGGVSFASGVSVAITGGGTVNLNGATTLNSGASITLSGASSLNITGALSLNMSAAEAGAAPIIDGAGCLVSATALTLTNYDALAGGEYALISTTNEAAEALAALFTDSAKFTVSNKNGVVTLAVADSSALVWNGGNGVWDETTENWLNASAAAHFTQNDGVTFASAGAQVTINGDKLTSDVHINADTEWLGNATVTTKTIDGSGVLTLGNGVKLAVTESVTGLTIDGTGTYAMPAGTPTLGVTLAETWAGTVALNSGSNTTMNIANLNLNAYGKEGSSVSLTGITGHFLNQNATFTPNLVLANSPDGSKAALEIKNGYSTNTYTFAGNISGTGNWVINSTTASTLTQNYVFTGDLSQWTGNMTQMNSAINLTFNGNAHQVGASLALTGGTMNIAGDGEVAVKSMTLSGGALTTNTALRANTFTMRGATVTLNADLKVSGALNLASDQAAAAGKVLTLADGVSITAASMTNAWGVVMHLGEGSSLTVDGTASISSGGTQRTWEGAGVDSSTVSFGALSLSNHANIVFRGMALHIGASGITQGDNANRIVLDNSALAADASFTATSASQETGLIELVNNVTVATGEHHVSIGSKVTGEGSLTKTGEGKLTLSGTNDFSGGLTVAEGTVEGAAASAFGSGAVTVEEAGTLELSAGDALSADQTVTNAGTVVLHDTVTLGAIVNNGSLVIASGFSGLESAGVTGIAGVSAAGNGFAQGGTATIFAPATASITGNLSATFGSATVQIDATTGKVTLGDDWSTYHMNNAPAAAETFGAIAGASAAHGVALESIEIVPESTTLTVDADGLATSMLTGAGAATTTLAVQTGKTVTIDTTPMNAITAADDAEITLNMGASSALNLTGAATLHVTGTDASNTLDLGNGTMTRDLSIVGVTVTSSHNGNSEGFNKGTTFIGAGGTLKLTGGNDSLGWGNTAAGTITLLGEEDKLATFALAGRATLKTNLVMQGNSLITAINPDDHETPMLDPYGGTLTVTGTNNTITTGVRQRNAWDVTVEEGASLAFDGTVLTRESANSGGISKKGDGTLSFLNASGTLHKYTADAGETVLDNSVFTVGSNLDLSHSDTARGTMKMLHGSALNFDNGVNLWINSHTSIALDETSSVNLTRNDYSVVIKGAAEGTLAEIAGTRNAYYDLNDACVFSNADVTMTSAADKTMGTKLVGSSITNAGAGTLTLSHAENTALTAVNAQGGNITLSAATTIGALTIADGKTVTASAEGPLSITTALTAGAGATLSSALSLANGTALDLATGTDALSLGNNAVTLGTGIGITETMMNAITALQADQSLTLIKGVSSLTGGDKAASDVISGLTGDYTIKVLDGNLVVSAAALPSTTLTWEGGDGIWGEGTPWTNAGEASAYVADAVVTINGEGGTITVQGAQTAKSVTIAADGYTIQRADSGTNSLTVTGALTVNQGVSFSSAFLPTVGSIVLNEGSELFFNNANYVNINGNLKNILGKISEGSTGTLKMTGGTGIADANRVMLGGQNLTISGVGLHVTDNMAVNTYQGAASLVVNSALTVDGELRLESLSKLDVQSGATVFLGTLTLGHSQANNPGHLAMAEGSSLTTGTIQLLDNTTQNTVNVAGGTLTVTGENAFTGTGTATTVAISNAKLTNGESDMTFNHASTMTNTTVSAKGDTTITVGAEGMTTTLVGSLTTEGKVTLDGTVDTTGLTAVNNSGALTVNGDATLSGLNNTGSLTVDGALTLADATTAGGTVTADSLTLTGANTFTAITTTGAVSVADSLNVTGMLTAGSVTLNKLSLTTTALTAGSVAGNSLALTADQQAIVTLMGTSQTSLTLAQVGGLTSATINGANGFKDGSRDYTIKVENGVVTLNVEISDQIVWDATSEGSVWGDGSSWEGNTQPTAESNVVFNGTGIADVSIAGNAVAGNIFVESETNFVSSTTGKVTTDGVEITKGTLTVGENVTVNATGVTTVKDTGNLVIEGTLNTDTLAATGKDVQLSGTLDVATEGAVNKIDGIDGHYGHLIVGTDAETMMLDLVENTLSVATDSTVDDLTVKNTGNLDAKGTFTVNSDADVAAGGVMTAAKDLTVTGALTNAGAITVGSAAAPATLAVGSVENDGTITVFNTLTSTDDVTNNAGATLDVKGNATLDGALTNSGETTVGGALEADSLTTNTGATTAITGNATLDGALTNSGETTVGGALEADSLTTNAGATTAITGNATLGGAITNSGETTVGGALAADSLTTNTGATTTITGTTELADGLTNKGTTTLTGAVTAGDVANTGTLQTGALTADAITNTGTVATTGNLKADSLSGKGATTVTGNAELGSLNLGTTGALTVSGTAKVDGVTGNGGSLTADTLDLSGLSSAATIANLKADKITLSGFNMLKVTDSLSNETGTGAAQLTLTLDDATMGALSVGDEKYVVRTDGSVSGQGVTLANLAAVNNALKAYGIKGAMVTTAAGDLVMQMQDNSFKSQVGRSENGIIGAEMMDEASAAGLATAGTAMADVYAALDACRETGNAEAGDRIASALSGSSIAAMGSALSGDVERQLKAIRNRTTTMGVDQSVINEDMPYFNAWVNAEGDYRKVAADGTLAGYKLMSWGGTVGMDVDVTPSFTCGLAATAMYGDFDAESEDHATGNLDTYYVSAFGRYAKHRWTHTFVATVGLAETSLDRTIAGHTVSGDSDGVMFGGMYEVGYVFALDKDATTCLQPIFNVSYTHTSLSGYDEDGGNIGLSASDVEFNKLTVGLGARLQSVIGENIYNRSSILEARALVKVDAGDRQGETDVTFAGSGLPSRTVKSTEMGAVGGEFGIGLTVPVGGEGGNIFVDASAEIRAEYTNVNGTVGYRVNF